MLVRNRWIITAISLFCCGALQARSLELHVRVQNSGAELIPVSQMCGLSPVALNGTVLAWELNGPEGVRVEGQRYCVDLKDMGPYQSRQVNLQWQSLATRPEGQFEVGADHTLLDTPSRELLQLADSFTVYPKTERVQRIHQWMLANIAFIGIRRGVDGVEHALLTRQGDCTEHMLLAGELLERNGFKVRQVLGAVLPKNARRLTAAALHNWVEYRVGSKWLVFDSSRGILGVPEGYDYIALHFYKDVRRLEVQVLVVDQPSIKLYLK